MSYKNKPKKFTIELTPDEINRLALGCNHPARDVICAHQLARCGSEHA
jgi:hypothetical protein